MKSNIERDAFGRLAVTYLRFGRRNYGKLGWGPVWTLFDRRKPFHWLVAFYVLLRDGGGVQRQKLRVTPR